MYQEIRYMVRDKRTGKMKGEGGWKEPPKLWRLESHAKAAITNMIPGRWRPERQALEKEWYEIIKVEVKEVHS